MNRIASFYKRFRDDESGAAMIEYTILLGIITVAVIGSIIFVGGWVSDQWLALSNALQDDGGAG